MTEHIPMTRIGKTHIMKFKFVAGIIPPTINLKEPDPECDLNNVPNKAVNADITLAVSNSLGFGGHNACLAFRKV